MLKSPVIVAAVCVFALTSDLAAQDAVAGTKLAADVLGSNALTTLNGPSLTVTNSGVPRVNDSAIIKTDILARNGVIHVIDAVLMPKN